MQTFLGILYTGMGAGGALADLSNITEAKMCRVVLALMDRKSLVNGLEPVGRMPMSLLAYTAWTLPREWTRQLIAAPQSRRRRSVWPQRFPLRLEAQPLQTCREQAWPNQ